MPCVDGLREGIIQAEKVSVGHERWPNRPMAQRAIRSVHSISYVAQSRAVSILYCSLNAIFHLSDFR
jgi:hypothetical protein